MKKIFLIGAVIIFISAGVYADPLDHFLVNMGTAVTTTGVPVNANITAYDIYGIKTDYTGPAYLSLAGGGQIIVSETGTNATGDFGNCGAGCWSGPVRILKAGTGQTVDAGDATVTSATSTMLGTVDMTAGPYQKLKILAENMVFAPGSVTGHTGTLLMHTTQQNFGVTVYACDAWNNPVVPPSETGIKITGVLLGGYISVTPYCDDYVLLDMAAAGASSITFTVSVWPDPNTTNAYTIKATDVFRTNLETQLQIYFLSLSDYYFRTHAPAFVTAGVPFGVTVKVSHFPEFPQNEPPDSTFNEQVRLKALNTASILDAVPVITNNQLTPYPTPVVSACAAGEAYFNIAYTRSTGMEGIYLMPIPTGVKEFANFGQLSSYSTYISVGAAEPYLFTIAQADEKLERGAVTQISVRPYDIFSNPVTGTAVNFSIVSGEGILSAASVLTNGQGIAAVNYTAPAKNLENIIYAAVAPLSVSKSVTILSELTEKFENWPNPFMAGKEITKINYSLPEDSDVTMRLYSSFGRLAWSKDIKAGEIEPGTGEKHGKKGGNTVIWDGTGDRGFVLGAGVYILKMTIKNSTGTKVQTRKIAIVK
jgi:hypothetical protein